MFIHVQNSAPCVIEVSTGEGLLPIPIVSKHVDRSSRNSSIYVTKTKEFVGFAAAKRRKMGTSTSQTLLGSLKDSR